MSDFKKRMYNYEEAPPEGVWESIALNLDTRAKVIPINRKKNYTWYYVAAASVIVILFCLIFFNRESSKSDEKIFTQTPGIKDDTANNNLIMTVPQEEKTIAKNQTHIETPTTPLENKSQKGGPNHDQAKDDKEDSNLLASNTPRYITIEGPQGQPVKISSKMALLIDSSETKKATKPVWHKKIGEWKEIMKTNTLAPTPGNFLDIIELTKSLRDNKK